MPNIIVNSNLIVCRQATRFPQALHGAIPTRRTWNSPENTFPWKVALEILNQTWGCGDLPCAKVGLQSNIARDIRFKPCDSFQTLSSVFYYGRFQQRGSVGQNRMICLSFALLYDQFPPFDFFAFLPGRLFQPLLLLVIFIVLVKSPIYQLNT